MTKKEYCDKCDVELNQKGDTFSNRIAFRNNILLCKHCAFDRKSKVNKK